MEQNQHSDIDDTLTDKIRSGEYYREARHMYDLTIHDPMSERYLFVAITGLAIMILLIAMVAARALYPLQASVPFIYNANDIVEDLPHIHSLLAEKGEDADFALLRFLTNNYLTMREEYNIETFDRNTSGVKSQSNDAVFNEYQRLVNPRNPESPISKYQRYSTRSIEVVSTTMSEDVDNEVEVLFDATVSGRGETKKTRWKANIAFNYSGIELDENGKVEPISFMITQYRTQRLQDVK